MNERIQELESQCWEPRQYGPAWFDSEKFAQLIIEECIQLVTNSQYQNTLDKYDEYFKGFNESLVFAQNRIQQHFGVNNEPTI